MTRYAYAGAHARDVHTDACRTKAHSIMPTACRVCLHTYNYYVPRHRA